MSSYETSPDLYRHWTLTIEPPVATLSLGVAGEDEPLGGAGNPPGLPHRAQIELADAIQRLRSERPDVGAVVVTGRAGDAFRSWPGNRFPAGAPPDANAAIFAAETLEAIEDASANSGQRWLTALNGTAAGPGYELALATDELLLIDDGRATVALPDLPLLGMAPAPDALARLRFKRGVRRDLIDVLCTRPEGVGGRLAQDWGLVDCVVTPERFARVVRARALAAAGEHRRPAAGEGVELTPLSSEEFDGGFAYPDLRVETDRGAGTACVTLVAPKSLECFAPEPGPNRLRSKWWPLAACRALDDALLRLRDDWPAIRTLIVRTEGDPLAAAAADVALMTGFDDDWFPREVLLYWRRTLKRLERAPQSVAAFIEPGSCFVGTLFELALAADRAYMFEGTDPDRTDVSPAEIYLTGMNFGPLPNQGGLTRLRARFPHQTDRLDSLARRVGDPIAAAEAARMGLVTTVTSAAGWNSTTRQLIRERNALAHDALARFTACLRGGNAQPV